MPLVSLVAVVIPAAVVAVAVMVTLEVRAPPRLTAAAVVALATVPLPVPAPAAWLGREEVGHRDAEVDPGFALSCRYIHDLDDANQRYSDCQQRR
jgi:hypothetical protein